MTWRTDLIDRNALEGLQRIALFGRSWKEIRHRSVPLRAVVIATCLVWWQSLRLKGWFTTTSDLRGNHEGHPTMSAHGSPPQAVVAPEPSSGGRS